MYFRLEMMIGYIKQRITEYEVRRKAEFLVMKGEVYGRNNQRCKRCKAVYP